MPAPATSSRHLYTGHHQGNMQAAPWLRARHHGCAFVPGGLCSPGFGAIVLPHDASAVVHTCSSSRRTPEPAGSGSFAATLATLRLLTDAACGSLDPRLHGEPGGPHLHHWHSTVRADELLHRHHSPFRTHHRTGIILGRLQEEPSRTLVVDRLSENRKAALRRESVERRLHGSRELLVAVTDDGFVLSRLGTVP